MNDLLRSPCCRARFTSNDLVCSKCGRRFAREDSIPVLIVETPATESQAEYFDHGVEPEFEIERPRGLPALHRWLLHEKFRRATTHLSLGGYDVLVVCGGSGMDAEFLVEAGCHVVTSDVSLGASRRAKERARRHGVEFDVIVADVTRLPFADRAVDIVYVHDGLHHIDEPLEGLREMARVARHAVVVTEPVDALVTSVAVKLGVALEREEAGNRVARMSTASVRAVCEEAGLCILDESRYGMFYRHEPGLPMRALSLPVIRPLAIGAIRAANAIFGRAGNKMTAVAMRQ